MRPAKWAKLKWPRVKIAASPAPLWCAESLVRCIFVVLHLWCGANLVNYISIAIFLWWTTSSVHCIIGAMYYMHFWYALASLVGWIVGAVPHWWIISWLQYFFGVMYLRCVASLVLCIVYIHFICTFGMHWHLWCAESLVRCNFGELYLGCNISLVYCIFGALHLWCYEYALLVCYA